MCGIAITTKDRLRESLLNQRDRGLDSLGILMGSEDKIFKTVRPTYKGYKKFIRFDVKGDGIALMHHRKASVGAVTYNNAHPFKGEKFLLMHNGTAKSFFNSYGTMFEKETDSETLLSYIENRVVDIEDIPATLIKLSDAMKEDLGNVIIMDRENRKVLFYSDGARESYLEISDDSKKVEGIFNYPPEGNPLNEKKKAKEGFENIGYIIMDFNFNILENTFLNINKDEFYDFYSGRHGLQYNEPTPAKSSYFNPSWRGGERVYQDFGQDEKNEYRYIENWLGENFGHKIRQYTSSDLFYSFLNEIYGVDSEQEYRYCYSGELEKLEEVFSIAYKDYLFYTTY